MKSKIDYGKIIAIVLATVLTTAMVSTSALNTFSEEEDEDEERENENEANEEDEEEDDEQEEPGNGTEDEEIKVKAEIIGDSTQAEIKIEFTTDATGESLMDEIGSKLNFVRENVEDLLEVETGDEEEEDLEEELQVKVETEDGKTEVEFKFKFVIDSTDRDAIIKGIVEKLSALELSADDIEFEVGEAKEEDDEELDDKDDAEDEVEEEIEVEAKIVDTSSLVEVKIEFTSSNTDKESLLKEILDKVRLDEEDISNALEIETEDDEELEEKLEVKVEIEDGKAEVEFEYKFVIDSTERNAIVAAIVDKLQTLELDEDAIELKVEAKGKSEVKIESKAKVVAKIAAKAKEAAEVKGKPEFVENIDKAERFFGKADKGVVALKIGLDSDDIESMSFGSAQLILIKFGEKEPMFRAVINILTDQPVDTLTACLDGQTIGQLTIIPTSEELGLSIGHLKETLSGMSITIPGVTVDVVEGTDCKGTSMLSGSI
jgi:hypothetical protein